MSGEDLAQLVADCGAPAWRAKQLRTACWQPFVQSLGDIAQLPADLRTSLGERLEVSTVTVDTESEADAGRTVKLLCRLGDGQTVEAVAMETPATDRVRARRNALVAHRAEPAAHRAP